MCCLCFTGKKFRCHLPGGHHRSARLQQDVRAVRPLHRHVLFQVEHPPWDGCRCAVLLSEPHVVDVCVFRNKHIMIDLGTGNNNKINWTMEDKQEMIDIVETVYRGARKGRGLVVSPKDYSTKYRYWVFYLLTWDSVTQNTDYAWHKSRIKSVFPVTKGHYLV